MKKLINYSITHPISILMYSILILLSGIISCAFIKMDFLPKLNDRTLLVSTNFVGLPAAQMKEVVTIPIENSFSSLKGIKNISSTTRDGLSFVKIELQYKTNIDESLIESSQIIDQLTQILPNNCAKPEVEIFSPNKNQLLTICMTPQNNDLIFARYIAEKEIKHILQTIKGVGKINISGGLEEEIQIIFDDKLLCSKNLSLENISQIITSTNIEYPAGTIKNQENEFILKTSNLYKNFDDILCTPIPTNSTPILIKDLGNVKSGNKEKETFCLLDNNECISFEVQKKSDANPIETSKLIKQKIKELNSNYSNIDFKIINDNSIEIKKSVIGVFVAAIFGMLITFFTIYFFFKNFKIAFLISSPILFCILFSISILKIFDRTINLFSLAGISISIGMIVDSAIIVIESILSNLKNQELKNFSLDEKILFSVTCVIKSNFSSALTTIIVFIPFFLIPGIFGELFSDLSIAIISSILFSFILSITFIPSVAKLFFKTEKKFIPEIQFIKKSKFKYKQILEKTISAKKIKIIILLSSIFIGAISLIAIKKEFIQTNKSKNLNLFIEYPNNFTIENIQEKTSNILNIIKTTFPDSSKIQFYATAGIEKSNITKLSSIYEKTNVANIIFFTKNESQKAKIKSILNNNGIDFAEKKYEDLISKAFDLTSNFIITSSDKNEFEKLHSKLKNFYPNEFSNEQKFIPDELKCNLYQIPKYFISYYIYELLEGVNAGTFYNDGKLTPIKTIIDSKNIKNIFDISIQLEQNQIPLSALGKFKTEKSNKILFRFNKQDAYEIESKSDLQKLTEEIYNTKISNPQTLKNSHIKIISLSREQFSELAKTATLLLAIVAILLYCILGAQFESFKLPIIFLLSLLPALAGAIFSLTIFNQSLNINSILSLVILLGIAINNSIILYESIINKKCEKMIFINSFIEKLKPILITTTTSFAALIPFTIDPFGINSQSSISIAICGGLFFSLIAILILIPNLLLKNSIKEVNSIHKKEND